MYTLCIRYRKQHEEREEDMAVEITKGRSTMITIRPFEPSDWPLIWQIIAPVFRAGETYAFAPEISEAEAHRVWIDMPSAAYVATDARDAVLGTYYIKPNQPALGAHVCNCGYIVGEHAQGKGVASLMCEHSQREARRLGFRAMQFNLVVSTNESAVRLWQKLGFAIVGTLPGAFQHAKYGFIDAFVMYKQLEVSTPDDAC
jgi:ribosomal protein S18 acetylase RimI-like enzyme